MKDPMITSPRTDADIVGRQAQHIREWKDLRSFVDVIPDILVAVNSTRQIVFANQAAVAFFQVKDASALWGKRPGEVSGCLHSVEEPGGCGESAACQVCGAFRSIMQGLEGKPSVEECRMALVAGVSLDLRIWAHPFKIGSETFVFVSIRDISDEKRRQALEKIFFHDLLNTAGGIQSIGEIMEHAEPRELGELRALIVTLSEQLVEEIRSQRELLVPERGELHVEMHPVNSRDAFNRVIAAYSVNPAFAGKSIRADETCEIVELVSDPTLLMRVLGNLVKNALEASAPGGLVTVGCRKSDPATVEFSIHNQGVIPRTAQLQIFNRSFSTKGAGRGLGTYSARLLTTRFMHGRTWFVSTPETQTVFYVELPIAR